MLVIPIRLRDWTLRVCTRYKMAAGDGAYPRFPRFSLGVDLPLPAGAELVKHRYLSYILQGHFLAYMVFAVGDGLGHDPDPARDRSLLSPSAALQVRTQKKQLQPTFPPIHQQAHGMTKKNVNAMKNKTPNASLMPPPS
jgi:hypothetical protein